MDKFAIAVYSGLLVYMIFLIFITLKSRKATKNDDLADFFTARGRLSTVPILFTTFATLFSTFTVVGMPGYFYTHGVAAWGFVVFADLLVGFVLFYYGVRVWRLGRENPKLASPLELIHIQYKSAWLSRLALVIMAVFILPFFAIQISGMGKLLEGLSGGHFPYWLASLLMAAILIVYSQLGGMRADVWTDVVQGLIMIIVMTFVGVGVFVGSYNGSLGELFGRVASSGGESLLSIPGPAGFLTRKSLLSFLFLFLAVPVVFPQMLSRYFGAKSERVLYASTIWFPIVTLFLFGMGALVGFSGAAEFQLGSGDEVMAATLRKHFGPFLVALMAAGVAAAAMSTADSLILALGVIFAKDIYEPIAGEELSERQLLGAGKIFMWLLIIAGFAVALDPPQLIVQLSILSLEGMVVLLPLYLGAVVFPRPDRLAAWISVIVGLVIFLGGNYDSLQAFYLGFRPGAIAGVVATLVYMAVWFVRGRRVGVSLDGG